MRSSSSSTRTGVRSRWTGSERSGASRSWRTWVRETATRTVVRAKRLDGNLWEVSLVGPLAGGRRTGRGAATLGRMAQQLGSLENGPSLRGRPASQASRRTGGSTSGRSSPSSSSSPTTSSPERLAEFRQRIENGEPVDELRLRGLRGSPRGVQALHGRPPLRRAADGRHRPPRGRHRRDEDRRGARRSSPSQPLYLNALTGTERPPRDGQRLPGQARRPSGRSRCATRSACARRFIRER